MKLFLSSQIAQLDHYTIEHEPIAAVDLMERAARAMTSQVLKHFPQPRNVVIVAGRGNNGGDAIAMARMLDESGYSSELYLLPGIKPLSGSAAIQLERLKTYGKVKIHTTKVLPPLPPGSLIIDGLFGTGLSRPLEGVAADWVERLNSSSCDIVSLDMPSGMMGEENSQIPSEKIVHAHLTLTLQFPKIAIFLAENHQYTGQVVIVDIKLHPTAIEQMATDYYLTYPSSVASMLPERSKFDHKGTFGHALIIAGSKGKMGAAVLAARSSLRSGAGLVTAHLPEAGYHIMQTAVPEAMCSCDPHTEIISKLPDLSSYNAIGVGPGLGTSPGSAGMLMELLATANVPLVIDADALNILASQPQSLKKLPTYTILTPHPGEFKRLFGATGGNWQTLQLARSKSAEYGIIIVLKGAHSAVVFPNGEVHFNATGNPGMATGGSGDVLTGLLAGFLAQGVTPREAVLLGVCLHGLAGDIASESIGEAALVAGDIIDHLGKAFLMLKDRRW